MKLALPVKGLALLIRVGPVRVRARQGLQRKLHVRIGPRHRRCPNGSDGTEDQRLKAEVAMGGIGIVLSLHKISP